MKYLRHHVKTLNVAQQTAPLAVLTMAHVTVWAAQRQAHVPGTIVTGIFAIIRTTANLVFAHLSGDLLMPMNVDLYAKMQRE